MAGKAKPVVGIIGNAQVVNDRHNVQVVGQRNMRAIAEVAGALPLMFAGTPISPMSTPCWARSTASC